MGLSQKDHKHNTLLRLGTQSVKKSLFLKADNSAQFQNEKEKRSTAPDPAFFQKPAKKGEKEKK